MKTILLFCYLCMPRHHVSIVTVIFLTFCGCDVAQLKTSTFSTKNLSHNYIVVEMQLHLSLFDFLIDMICPSDAKEGFTCFHK